MKGRRAGEQGGIWTDDMAGYSIAPRGGARRGGAGVELASAASLGAARPNAKRRMEMRERQAARARSYCCKIDVGDFLPRERLPHPLPKGVKFTQF